MPSIINLFRGAAARGALFVALLLLSSASSLAHDCDLSKLKMKGPWSQDCPSITFSDFIKNDATMQQAIRLAWSLSHEGTADEHEVGFIAYQERRKTSGGYEYRTVIDNVTAGPTGGGGTEVTMPPPIKASQYRTVMLFHTHPGPASEQGGGYNDYPSDTDFEMALTRSIPSGIAYGSGPTWSAGDYLAFGGSFRDQRGDKVTATTPGAKEIEVGETGTVWFLNISQSHQKWWGWRCPKPVKVTGNSTASVGNSGASGDRLTKRTIRAGTDGLETVESPHPAVPGPGGPQEGSVASTIPSMAGMEQVMKMTGQSMTPEQIAQMNEALQGAMASPAVGLAMNSGWIDRERVEFIPLEYEPVVCSTSLKKTYPSFMSHGQDKVTGSSSARTTFTSLPETETGFAFVTVQEIRANSIGRAEGGPETITRSRASASASAVIDGTITLEYSQASSLDLDLSLSQRGNLSSPDPAIVKPPLQPGQDLYWEATAIVADRDGRMVDMLRFPRLTCPVNDQVAETWNMPLPLPPEGQVYTVTLDCSQQGGNYSAWGPGTVPGGWTTVKVTLNGQASASLSGPKEEPESDPQTDPDLPVS